MTNNNTAVDVDSEEEFDMEVCQDAAIDAMCLLASKEGRTPGFDFIASVFCVFVNSIETLVEAGWLAEDLVNEVITHAEDADVGCAHCAAADEEDSDEAVLSSKAHLH